MAGVIPWVVFVVFAAWAYLWSRDSAYERMQRTLDLIQEHASKVFDTYDLLLSYADELASQSEHLFVKREQDIHERLSAFKAGLPQVQDVWIIDKAGHGLASANIYPLPAVDLSDRDYFSVFRDQDAGLYISQILTGRLQNVQFFQFARRRRTEDGSFNGVVAVSVQPQYFSSYYAQLVQSGLSSVGIQRADGAVLARYPEPRMAIGPSPPDSPFMRAIAHSPVRGLYAMVSPYDGVERLLAYRLLDRYPIYVSVGLDKSAILQSWLGVIVGPACAALLLSVALFWMTKGLLDHARREEAALVRLRDETRLREAVEADRNRADALYRAYYQNATESLFVIRVGADHRFTLEETNPAHERVTGLSSSAHRGLELAELVPAGMAERIRENYVRCVQAGKPIRYEEVLDFGHGPRQWETALAPVRGPDGQINFLVGSARDITERTELEERVRQSERLEALAILTSGVAHDFNNLLTVLMGNLELMKRGKPERLPRLLDTALQAVEQGRRVTGQLLAFGRRQPANMEMVSLTDAIHEMSNLISQALRGDIVRIYDFPDDLWPVTLDKGQFQAALINLASNARDAMPAGGTLTVQAANTTLHRNGEVLEGVALTVADTGTGMSGDVLKRAFEPFFTTKKVGKGTGLGLAQVYGFARQSGGHVEIKSEEGHGTRVTIFLPRAVGVMPASTRASMAAPAQTGPLRILLAEDNREVAAVSSDLLTLAGHSVRVVPNAEAALEALQSEPFDMLVSDMVMPGSLSGLDLARKLRAQGHPIPILLATGYSEVADEGVREGFRILAKPFHPEKLLEAIAGVVDTGGAASNVIRVNFPPGP